MLFRLCCNKFHQVNKTKIRINCVWMCGRFTVWWVFQWHWYWSWVYKVLGTKNFGFELWGFHLTDFFNALVRVVALIEVPMLCSKLRFISRCLVNYEILFLCWGTVVAQWLRCCATNRKVAGSIPAGVIGISHWHKILPTALWRWGRLSL